MEKKFILKIEHIKLISKFYISWDDSEFGAPGVDPKRPYGNSDVHLDIVEILGYKKDNKVTIDGKEYLIDEEEYFPEELCDKLDKIHKELEMALQIVLQFNTFVPGEFIKKESWKDWEKLK